MFRRLQEAPLTSGYVPPNDRVSGSTPMLKMRQLLGDNPSRVHIARSRPYIQALKLPRMCVHVHVHVCVCVCVCVCAL